MRNINESILAVGLDFWKQVASEAPSKRYPFHQKLQLERLVLSGEDVVRVAPARSSHTTYLEFRQPRIDGTIRVVGSTFKKEFTQNAYVRRLSNDREIEQEYEVSFEWEDITREVKNQQRVIEAGVRRTIKGTGTVGVATFSGETSVHFDWSDLTAEENTTERREKEKFTIPIKVPPFTEIEYAQLEDVGTLTQRTLQTGMLNAEVCFYSKNNFDMLVFDTLEELSDWVAGRSSKYDGHYVTQWLKERNKFLNETLRQCQQEVSVSYPNTELGTSTTKNIGDTRNV